jgi:hypothetical protein
VFDACFDELLSVILGFVQPHYLLDSKLLEDGDIVIWCKGAVLVSNVERARERNELTWDDPV